MAGLGVRAGVRVRVRVRVSLLPDILATCIMTLPYGVGPTKLPDREQDISMSVSRVESSQSSRGVSLSELLNRAHGGVQGDRAAAALRVRFV